MTSLIRISAVVLAFGLGACATGSSTDKSKEVHYAAPLGSHIPGRYNDAANTQQVDPATSGAHPFANGSATSGMGNAGGGR